MRRGRVPSRAVRLVSMRSVDGRFAQVRDAGRVDVRWRAEARGHIVGDGGDLRVGVGGAERRHAHRAVRPPLAGQHDLGDVGCAGIVDGADAGEGRIVRQQADPAPAVTAGAGALEDLLAARIEAGLDQLRRIRRRIGPGRGQTGRADRQIGRASCRERVCLAV